VRIRGFLPIVLAILVAIFYGIAEISAEKTYERTIGSFWELSERASTLDMKADYLNRFVAGVDSARLSGNDAIIYPTPQNSVEQNITTAKSLQTRMNEIRGMDVTSFQYQQAISQVTAQEQGEAGNMLHVIEGRWFLTYHPLLWGWIQAIIVIGLVVTASFGIGLLMFDNNP